jgi:nucleoside-diphosphate-sugar epimerase
MTRFAEAVSREKPLIVYGNGEQTRDFTFVSDATDAIVRAMERDEAIGETFNIGTGIPSTINKLASLFSNLGGSKSSLLRVPARSGEIRYSYADISKAMRVIGYGPQVPIEKGVESFMQWYEGNTRNRI